MKRSKLLIGLIAACVLAFGLIAAGPLAGLAQEADTPLTTDSGIALETQATKYQVWVAGKQVTSANASNVLGNGTVKYNAKTNTLTLKNAKITTAEVTSKQQTGYKLWWNFAISAKTGKALTINLVGKNKIAMPSINSPIENYGIWVRGDLVIGGKGSLTVTANKAQAFSAGIMARTLIIKGKAKVSSKGVATKVTNSHIGSAPNNGGYGVIIEKLVMKGNARLTAIGAKTGFYKPFNPKFGFAKGYTPHVKAGASAKSIKVNKNKPAKSVYTKYKYVNITKAAPAVATPAQVGMPSVYKIAYGAPVSGLDIWWNALTSNCTGYEVQIYKGSSYDAAAVSQRNRQVLSGISHDNARLGTPEVAAGTGLRGTYHVRVRAINTVGSTTKYGPWSAVASISL